MALSWRPSFSELSKPQPGRATGAKTHRPDPAAVLGDDGAAAAALWLQAPLTLSA